MSQIVVVGGINIDIEGKPYERLRHEDSNPGTISIAWGGVGRNIAENVARIGGDVAMVSVIGDDQMGQSAVAALSALGINTDNVAQIPGKQSSMYMSILDENSDMELGLSDMDIIENITPDFLKARFETIKNAKIIALDGNLSSEILAFCTEMFEGIPLFLDPVSASKAVKARDVIGKFHSIKPNKIEAEVLCGMKIESLEDLKRAGKWFIDKGVERVYITLNKDGVYYKSKDKEGIIKPILSEKGMKSATGAGDSFSATILQGTVSGLEIDQIAAMGSAAASIAMESSRAVNEEMNISEIKRRIEQCIKIF